MFHFQAKRQQHLITSGLILQLVFTGTTQHDGRVLCWTQNDIVQCLTNFKKQTVKAKALRYKIRYQNENIIQY